MSYKTLKKIQASAKISKKSDVTFHGITLYNWQVEAVEALKNSNAILSAPTGSGKTIVSKLWADIDNENQKIIFTAPIKALSNNRYAELLMEGYDTGIDTGDFKENTDARIICCTQEVYTNKYANLPNMNVIIDEFHYVANNPDRTRPYIDGIRKTNLSSRIMVISATFGNTEEVKLYLERIKGQPFNIYENDERSTDLIITNKKYKIREIKNALIFVFSSKNCVRIANDLYRERGFIKKEKQQQINMILKLLNIKSKQFKQYTEKGIGTYYGSMLPKEKLATEILFKKGLIDVVVGTDALSLGVNLPAETVIFAQLAKYYTGPLAPSEFYQMAGRAGRKGYFDTGYIGLYEKEDYESYDFEYAQKYLLEEIVNQNIENMKIDVGINFKKILSFIPINEKTNNYILNLKTKDEYEKEKVKDLNKMIKEEVDDIVDISLLHESEVNIRKRKTKEISYFFTLLNKSCQESKEKDAIVDVLKEIYFHEVDILKNIYFCKLFLNDKFDEEKIQYDDYRDLLQLIRFVNGLPEIYKSKVKNLGYFEKVINELDDTIQNFAEYKNKFQ
jgi:DEAD/DEAH box helicase domain protein